VTLRRQPKHRPKLGGMAVSLLNELLSNTLDQGYAEAARRRAGPDAPALPLRRAQLITAAGLLLAGLLGGLGYAQAQRSAPESARVKLALIRDIDDRTVTSNDLERHLDALAAQVTRDRDAALAASEQGTRTRASLQQLESQDGLLAVRGPGVEVTVGDAPPLQETDPVTGVQQTIQPDENGRITDRDLQIVVNALWSAGAEAIAIDGRRLTATTTIREAGGAILVDFFPVTTPYQIEAIGDPDRLLPRFVDSRTGQQYQTYVGAYRIEFDVQRREDLALHAAAGTDLAHAVPVESAPAAAPGMTTDSSRVAPGGSTSPPAGPTGTPTSGGGS
jgi:uncharacterized protein YlxW (UPF0749 family)